MKNPKLNPLTIGQKYEGNNNLIQDGEGLNPQWGQIEASEDICALHSRQWVIDIKNLIKLILSLKVEWLRQKSQ